MKTFEEFRRELADAVTVAINKGVTIGYGDGDICPTEVRGTDASQQNRFACDDWGIKWVEAFDFVTGFYLGDDDSVAEEMVPGSGGAFRELGRLYRRRFVVKVNT